MSKCVVDALMGTADFAKRNSLTHSILTCTSLLLARQTDGNDLGNSGRGQHDDSVLVGEDDVAGINDQSAATHGYVQFAGEAR